MVERDRVLSADARCSESNVFKYGATRVVTIDRIVSCPAVLPDRDRRSSMFAVRPFAHLYRAGMVLVTWRLSVNLFLAVLLDRRRPCSVRPWPISPGPHGRDLVALDRCQARRRPHLALRKNNQIRIRQSIFHSSKNKKPWVLSPGSVEIETAAIATQTLRQYPGIDAHTAMSGLWSLFQDSVDKSSS